MSFWAGSNFLVCKPVLHMVTMVPFQAAQHGITALVRARQTVTIIRLRAIGLPVRRRSII